MSLPKITDAGIQNKTQDTASDRIDALHQATTTTGKNKKENNKKSRVDKSQNTDLLPLQKKKGYKEGNKDDSTNDEFDIDDEMHAHGEDDGDFDDRSYGKRL